ncbi:MAG: metallophosphoesterase [Calditrichaeota bacterium]|nr:metallophosphoesterase [Calditrichota bacterium]MCB9391321.1 metallophosphoesterase [Calditrichota bacterium]
MHILLVHISDIHFGDNDNPLLDRIPEMASAIVSQSADVKGIAFCISGDIAYSGQETQYETASQFLNDLLSEIEKNKQVPYCIIVCPGNHDCSFGDESDEVRNLIIAKIQSSPTNSVSDALIRQCVTVQKEFVAFQERIVHGVEIVSTHELIKTFVWNIADKRISFRCMNSSWMSQLHEEAATLIYPFESILEKSPDPEKLPVLTVGLFHHHSSWLNPENRRKVDRYLRDTCDLVLTGHEHEDRSFASLESTGGSTGYSESGAAQSSHSKESIFSIIRINLEACDHARASAKWDGKQYVLGGQLSDTKPVSFLNSQRRLGNMLLLDDEFQEYLSDPGAQYTHPHKRPLRLSDLYVAPMLQEIKILDEGARPIEPVYLSAAEVIKLNTNFLPAIVTGSDQCGKTALLRSIYVEAFEKGLLPILIDGQDISSTQETELEKQIAKSAKAQYKNIEDNLGLLQQRDKIVLLVDDFDKSRLKGKARAKSLSSLIKRSHRVIISGHETFRIEEFLSASSDDSNSIRRAHHFRILEFNFKLRSDLISRWITLGREDTIDDEEFVREHEKAKRSMDRLAARSVVPSYPVFLYAVMQMQEASGGPNLKLSAYAQYFDVLLFEALKGVINNPEDIDAAGNYLGELARRMYDTNVEAMSISELHEFHVAHNVNFQVDFIFESQISRLSRAHILREEKGRFQFKYSYEFYFYLAKQLASTLSEEKTRSLIEEMCANMHQRHHSYILLFLTYHTKDPFVLDRIINAVQSVFSDKAPINLQTDAQEINRLLTSASLQIAEEIKIERFREEELEKEEREHKDSQIVENEMANSSLDMDALSFPGKLNLTFKSVELLGQIVNNYYGSLPGSIKVQLSDEAFNVVRRAISAFVDIVEAELSSFLAWTKGWVQQQDKEIADEDLEHEARKIIFFFTSLGATGCIAKVAAAIGNEKLEKTFAEIVNSQNCNAARLIDIAIKLRHYKHFPDREISALLSNAGSNLLVKTIVQQLVRHYLYMMPIDYKTRQQISELVGIKVSSQREIGEHKTENRIIDQPL